jgi:hypothetical protein
VLVSKTGIFALILLVILSACQTAEPTLEGPIMPTRIATGTPTNTPTPSPSPTATNTPLPTLTPTPEIPSVQIGEAYTYEGNGTITSSDWRVFYIFTANVGDAISVVMKTDSPRLDPLIILEDSNGHQLFVVDDAVEGNDNAAIREFEIKATGTYTLIATRRGEEDSPYIGDFHLSFERLPLDYRDPVSGISLRPIEPNQMIIGEISDEIYYIAYIFTGTADEVISIEMNRLSSEQSLDAYLILINRRTQQRIAFNDDDERGETTNAYISNFTLPETGEYIILATRYQGVDGTSIGEFSIQVIRGQ